MYIIGIKHMFSCINVYRVPRKLFEHEVDRISWWTRQMFMQWNKRMINILAYFILLRTNLLWKRFLNSKIQFFLLCNGNSL